MFSRKRIAEQGATISWRFIILVSLGIIPVAALFLNIAAILIGVLLLVVLIVVRYVSRKRLFVEVILQEPDVPRSAGNTEFTTTDSSLKLAGSIVIPQWKANTDIIFQESPGYNLLVSNQHEGVGTPHHNELRVRNNPKEFEFTLNIERAGALGAYDIKIEEGITNRIIRTIRINFK